MRSYRVGLDDVCNLVFYRYLDQRNLRHMSVWGSKHNKTHVIEHHTPSNVVDIGSDG